MTTDEIRDSFEKKLHDAYEKCIDEWLNMTPDALIDNADVISATQDVRFHAGEYSDMNDLKYFLRFKNPLLIMRDLKLESMTAYPLSEDEVRDMVSVMRERCGAELDYEMDENYIPDENGGDISPERASYLLSRAICYIGKFERGQDLYDTLHEIVGMSDEEIEGMGFEHLTAYFQDEQGDGQTLIQ